MTDIQDYYKNLLIIQYHNKPKAKATVEMLADCATGDEILLKLYDAFNVDKARGKQLDLLGEFVGVKRNSLDDNDYRKLILFGATRNNIAPTMKNIDDAIYNTFGDEVTVVNGQNMTITYIFSSDLSNIVQEAIDQNLLPKPLGIEVLTVTKGQLPDLVFGFQRGTIETEAVGFSTKDGLEDGTFLTKSNL